MWIRKNRKDRLTDKNLPLPTQVVSNEEFYPMPQTLDQKAVEDLILSMADEYGRKLGMTRRQFLATSGGMAAAFLAMNKVHGEAFRVSQAEITEPGAFAEQWPKDQFIFDVQTHHVKDSIKGPAMFRKMTGKLGLNPELAGVSPGDDSLHRANYYKEIFYDSDTVMAMITGAVIGHKEHFALPTDEMVKTRDLLNEAAGSQRMLSHGLGDPTLDGALDDLEYQVKELGIDAVKFYPGNPTGPWRLDDEEIAYPYFEKCQELGMKNLSFHKGLPLPGKVPEGKPKGYYWMPDDIPTVAKAFPDLNFIIYHSAMENMVATLPPGKSGIGDDGYIAWTTDLVKSMKEDPSLTNVYAELGTVFAFSVVTHPEIAAHLLGQLHDGFGAERILWGTDCIWWGSPQWLIEAYRRFQIPEQLRDQFGYKEITEREKEIIFGLNAAGLYDIDVDAVRKAVPGDKLTAMKAAYREEGPEPSNTAYGWVLA
ncbi:MAG: amidohydrolase [Gammaproteobacteria bacterium]|nr:amidohydrolase [Gammaproteobacteria bacterium]NND37872.1 amidohydrolase [Gammaproteobacteria bacterium]